MMSGAPGHADLQLSVVIPSFNSAEWLPTTLDALAIAIRIADLRVQVVVVDDGSTDTTPDVVDAAARSFPGSIELVRQENRGRFLARWEGLRRSRAGLALLLDSRVLIEPGSLAHVFAEMTVHPERTVWNAHVHTDPAAPLVGLFWDVPTYIFWGSYLRSPRPIDITSSSFDSVPKGTTMFLAPIEVLKTAFEYAWPSGDARLVSDDTKLLRRIAETRSIRLDPGFAAIYRPRTTLRGFVSHTFTRGTLFVDSYAGTSALRSAVIIALVVAPLALIALLIGFWISGQWLAAFVVVLAVVLLAAAPIVPAALNRCPPRSLMAYLWCLPVFTVPFWLGLVRGIVVHRGAFRRRARASGSRLGRREHA